MIEASEKIEESWRLWRCPVYVEREAEAAFFATIDLPGDKLPVFPAQQ